MRKLSRCAPYLVAVLVATYALTASCSKEPSKPGESVTTPAKPQGPTGTEPDSTEQYQTGGAICSGGHPVEYRFAWGDTSYSDWAPSATATHSWNTDGAYKVSAQARCQVNTAVISAWSESLTVTVSEEVVGTPSKPSGEDNICLEGGGEEEYETGGSSSSHNRPIEYYFDWGDGNHRNWSEEAIASHLWRFVGQYEVRTKARSIDGDSFAESAWSEALLVTVNHEVVDEPTGISGVSEICPDSTGDFEAAGGSSSCGHSLEYEFDWGDQSPFVWGSQSRSHAWTTGGTYAVRAKARCATHTEKESIWSTPLSVVVGEAITVATPTGPDSVCLGHPDNAYTASAENPCNHPMQYKFKWDAGEEPSWSDDPTRTYTWGAIGIHQVSAMARCTVHQDQTSGWSEPLQVKVPEGVYIEISWEDVFGQAHFDKNYPADHALQWTSGNVSYSGTGARCEALPGRYAAWFNTCRDDTPIEAVGHVNESGGVYVDPSTQAIKITLEANTAKFLSTCSHQMQISVGSCTRTMSVFTECGTYEELFYKDEGCYSGDHVAITIRVPGKCGICNVVIPWIRISFLGWCGDYK